MKEMLRRQNLAFAAEALDVLIEQLDLSTQDMGLQFRFVIATTPCILPSLRSPNLRSHSDDKGPLDELAVDAVSRLGQGQVAPDESHNDS
jgi:hypothetical protein